MPSYIFKKNSYINAEEFINSFSPTSTATGYVFLAKNTEWGNESIPDDIDDSTENEKNVWNNMYFAKKITVQDVKFVAPKIDWTANTKYRQYDDRSAKIDLWSANTSQNLQPIYVMNSENNVYKCICNNVGSISTVEPTGKDLNANGNISTGDGYLWKYMYNIRASNKFLTQQWMPAPTNSNELEYSTSSLTAVDGELVKIAMTNNGSGYTNQNVFVSSFSSGCTTLTVLNTGTSNVFNIATNTTISGTGIISGSYIQTVDTSNSRIIISLPTNTSGGTTNAANVLFVQTRAVVEGDGTGALAQVNLSGNTVGKITVTNYGRNYSNALVRIYGTGSDAAARVVLPPKYGHSYNPAKEIGATNVMIATRIGEIDSTEGGILSSNTSFRQYGLLKDPHKYGELVPANNAVSNTTISQTTDVNLVSGDVFNLNEFVYQGSISSPTFSGFVHDQDTNTVRLTNVKGTSSVGVVLKGSETNLTGRIVISKIDPDLEPYTGDVLFVDNIVKIDRTEGQAENIKFVIKF